MDPRINKEPWKPEEEMIFIDKHKVYGNKWAEIAKFLPGRNDNSVKNYFYSSVRKNIRKISMKRMTYDLKENEVERELTIYLSQYILQMYRDYLEKKKKEKSDTKIRIHNLDSNGDLTMDNGEEAKSDANKSLKSGDKYIIRKLVSLKITPEHIEEYINMLISGSSHNQQSSTNGISSMNYAQYTPNMNQMGYYNQQFLGYPQNNQTHQRASSLYNDNRNMHLNGASQMGVMDDSTLINRFGNFNLVNQNMNYLGAGGPNYPTQNTIDQYQLSSQNPSDSNDPSMENNYSSNADPLCSVPPNMRNDTRPNRSHSIGRMPESSSYMQENFLFDKFKQNNAKDDNVLYKDQHPLNVENQERKQFMPRVLKYRGIDVENCSSPSRSSQSSMYSFNDAASVSSLDMSFDNSGMPYLKPSRASAFSRVKSAENSERSNSLGDKNNEGETEEEKTLNMDPDDSHPGSDSRNQNKSSFFRLKNEGEKDQEIKQVQ